VSDSDDDAKPEAPVEDGNGKLERDLEDAHRPLEPWERYRALNDAFDLEQELIDLGDHKARFALVILTGLNAVAFLMVARTDFLATLPQGLRPFLGLYVFLYGAAAVYFFFQAIESLKPRIYMGDADKDLLGLRFFAGILKRDEEEYRQTWSNVRVDQLSDEIAEQVHTLSRINQDKYRALYRLYLGLQILTVLTGGLIAVFELGQWL
jgi:hypothetical protein